MTVIFISNALYHHQIPLSLELEKCLGEGNFKFIATTPSADEQLQLGYPDGNSNFSFVINAYEKENWEEVIQMIKAADLVIWGGAPHLIAHKLLKDRIHRNGIIFRYSERIFKKGMIQAINPLRILYMIFLHTRFRRKPLYMLCASAYLPSELSLFRAYPGKMYRWGYFPPFKKYKIDQLMNQKECPDVKMLWVGRLIDWKHPEVILEVCKLLQLDGLEFHLDIVGRGELQPSLEAKILEYGLSLRVSMCGAMPQEKVREKMEQSNILISTSDFHEGWGVVINEAMNSGCVVIASHAIGSVPYLIKHDENGLIYRDGDLKHLYTLLREALKHSEKRVMLGTAAYHTIETIWNAENAAKRLLEVYENLKNEGGTDLAIEGPGSLIQNSKSESKYFSYK